MKMPSEGNSTDRSDHINGNGLDIEAFLTKNLLIKLESIGFLSEDKEAEIKASSSACRKILASSQRQNRLNAALQRCQMKQRSLLVRANRDKLSLLLDKFVEKACATYEKSTNQTSAGKSICSIISQDIMEMIAAEAIRRR
ncbi:hypothetical protein [Azospirillum sp. B2RO_4]|uniref:hypothetical protein n=1 Tax=Azospirillum sp. B2RO_4 TaxID=3027796 RepID=UPI003DA8FF32